MRIGLVGAGGTGKSTLGKLLAVALGMTFKPSISREVFQERGLVEADQLAMTVEQRLELQTAILQRKAYQDKFHGKNAVFDRTPIDHLGYLLYRASNIVSDEVAEELEDLVRGWMRDYDYVIYTPTYPWVFANQADGMRQGGKGYNLAYDALLRGLLSRLGVPFLVTPDADPITLCESVVAHIRAKERERACNQLVAGRDREGVGEVPGGTVSPDQPPPEAKHDSADGAP